MSTDLVTQNAQSRMEICRQSICSKLSDAQFKYFWAVADRKGLDPLSGEIHAVIRKVKNQQTGNWEDVLTIQTGIDGYRHMAEDTGEYDGQEEPIFDREPDYNGRGPLPVPVWCKVTVHRLRAGRRVSVTAKVYFHEFAQRNKEGQLMGGWARMPYLMLAKVAEVQAIRKAFPRRTAGLQHDAEIVDVEAVSVAPAALKPVAQAIAAIEAKGAVQIRPEMLREWNTALAAFANHGVGADKLLEHLHIKGIAEFREEHIDQLSSWYDSLQQQGEVS